MPDTQKLYVHSALLADGWASNVAIEIDGVGIILSVRADVPAIPQGSELLSGVLVAGMPNCHSHAFQRAMVGLTEVRGNTADSFWSWRDAMYRLLENIGPEQLQAISEQLYVEMLKLGYTHYELKQFDQSKMILQKLRENHPDSTAARLAAKRLDRIRKEGH